jgi:aromatase
MGNREVRHEITVHARAGAVYRLVADVSAWPDIFPPTVHAERVSLIGRNERIRIWATVNGQAASWTSARRLDPRARRVDFRQEECSPPVAAMGGSWLVEPLSDVECRVVLLHDYRAVDDDPGALAWLDEAVDRNSRSELAALKTRAELDPAGADAELMSFTDTVRIDGSVQDVYDFLNEAQHWPDRLPHVARVSLVEDNPGLQVLEMDTTTSDGSAHRTRSIRVCFPHHRIVYKQTVLPALLTAHSGCWQLAGDGYGVTVTARHTVAINPAGIAAVLGADAGIERGRAFVRETLGANSRATLGHARRYAEVRPSKNQPRVEPVG